MVAGKPAEAGHGDGVKIDPPPGALTADLARGAGVNVEDANESAQFFRYKGKLASALEAQKKANKAVQDLGKNMKRDCGDHAFAAAKLAIKAGASDEGFEPVKGEVEYLLKMLRWQGLPVGSQGSLFESDRRPVEEKAYFEGRVAGLEGISTLKNNPHDAATPAFQEWSKGFHDGQGYHFDKMPGAKGSADILKGAAADQAKKDAKAAAPKPDAKAAPKVDAKPKSSDAVKAAADRAEADAAKKAGNVVSIKEPESVH